MPPIPRVIVWEVPSPWQNVNKKEFIFDREVEEHSFRLGNTSFEKTEKEHLEKTTLID